MQLMGTKISLFFFFIQKGGEGVKKFPILKKAGVICSAELGSWRQLCLESSSQGKGSRGKNLSKEERL